MQNGEKYNKLDCLEALHALAVANISLTIIDFGTASTNCCDETATKKEQCKILFARHVSLNF